jgi:site-specific DNA-methyltransferase (adenine-specific)
MFILSKGKPKTINLLCDRWNKQAGSKICGNSRQKNGNLSVRSGKGNLIPQRGVRWNIWEYSTGWQHSYNEIYLKGHPAIFPEQLVQDHILSWSNENDLIYDPFMGSGTVAKVALLKNRKFIGSEISQEYYRIADKRIKEAKNRIEGGLFK